MIPDERGAGILPQSSIVALAGGRGKRQVRLPSRRAVGPSPTNGTSIQVTLKSDPQNVASVPVLRSEAIDCNGCRGGCSLCACKTRTSQWA